MLKSYAALLIAGSLIAANPAGAIEGKKGPGESTRSSLAETASENSTIDLVLCLDTSNSMDGLIDSAKMKLWDIVNVVGKADPSPSIRVALYSYGNDGYSTENGWVRRELSFTSDLDLVYEKLFELRTNGGTEYVARVTRATLQEEWSPTGKNTLKMVFVAGNEPADQDTRFGLRDIMSTAYGEGIYVNAIYCGSPTSGDAKSWRQAASYGGGSFSAINPDRTVVYTTVYDDELAELSTTLNSTYLYYGAALERRRARNRQSAMDVNSLKMGSGVAAARASAKADSAVYSNSTWDLVDAINKNKVDLDELAEEELPEELRGISTKEIRLRVEEKNLDRQKIQKRIKELNRKREADISRQRKEAADGGENTFDAALKKIVIQQAMDNGITIDE